MYSKDHQVETLFRKLSGPLVVISGPLNITIHVVAVIDYSGSQELSNKIYNMSSNDDSCHVLMCALISEIGWGLGQTIEC